MTTSNHSELENNTVKQYQNLVKSIVKSFHPANSDVMDYIQEANIALLRAIRNYNSKRGACISTLATIYIRRALSRYRQQSSSLLCFSYIDNEPFYEHKQYDLWEILPENLSDIELIILYKYCNGYTFREIGQQIGYSTKLINSIYKNIIQKSKYANR